MPAPTYPLYLTKAGQTLFTVETPQGGFMPDHPFGEPCRDALVITQRFWQRRANYARPAANAQNCSAYPAAYFIQDAGFRDVGMGIVEWVRTWATIPPSWSEPESYAFFYPAYAAGATGAAKNVNGIVQSGATTIFSLSVAGDAVAGDSVYVNVNYTRNGIVRSSAFQAVAVATTNAAQVTVAYILPGSGAFSAVSGSVTKSVTGVAAPRSLVVGSRVAYDYALSSLATLDADLPLAPLFAPIDAAGLLTDRLTSTTIPSDADYRAMVNAGAELVVESTRHRYLGNIFVRTTRMVPAK